MNNSMSSFDFAISSGIARHTMMILRSSIYRIPRILMFRNREKRWSSRIDCRNRLSEYISTLTEMLGLGGLPWAMPKTCFNIWLFFSKYAFWVSNRQMSKISVKDSCDNAIPEYFGPILERFLSALFTVTKFRPRAAFVDFTVEIAHSSDFFTVSKSS